MIRRVILKSDLIGGDIVENFDIALLQFRAIYEKTGSEIGD